MFHLFESLSWLLSSIIVVLFSILFFLTILLIIRRKISIETLKKNHDVAGFTFSIIGVLYSVILGFTVVSSQERYNEVEKNLHIEAFMLADLYRYAGFFSDEDRNTIRSHLRSYVNYVIQEDWGAEVQKKISFKKHSIMEQIWRSYYEIDLTDKKVAIWYKESISKLDDLMNASLARHFSTWDKLGSFMWTILISGGIITVCFMFFFGLENIKSQMLMTSLLAGYLSIMLFLVFTLDHVFKGPAGIKPTVFEQVISLFNRWDDDNSVECSHSLSQ